MVPKIKTAAKLSRILASARAKGDKVVFTNGCFDILHVGHVEYLAKAKKFGSILVVGLNSDSSVKKIKGPDLPINAQAARAKVLLALHCVDYVVIFNEATPEKLIEALKPDVLVKGGDWKIKDIVGGEFVRSRGGCVKTIKFVDGYSTTSLINRMRK